MSSSDDSSGQGQLSSTVLIAVRMVQTSIGLAGTLLPASVTFFVAANMDCFPYSVGLFAAAVVVYPFRRSKGFIFAF